MGQDSKLNFEKIALAAYRFEQELEAAPAEKRTPMIAQRMAEADLVLALWEVEEAEQLHVRVMKGRALLRELADADDCRLLHVAGIACASPDEVAALVCLSYRPKRPGGTLPVTP